MDLGRRIAAFWLLLLSGVVVQMAGCAERSQPVYFDVENPRQLGEEKYITVVNGHAVGRTSSPGANSVTVRDYMFNISAFAKLTSGAIVKPSLYRANRSGPMDSVQYEKVPQAEEKEMSPRTALIFEYPDSVDTYIFLVRSEMENTGVRVLRVDRKTVEQASEQSPIKMSDPMTLPKLEDDPDAKRLSALYSEIKKR